MEGQHLVEIRPSVKLIEMHEQRLCGICKRGGTLRVSLGAVKTSYTPEITLRKSRVEGGWDLASPYVVHPCLHAQWSCISGLVGGGDKDLSQGEQASRSRAVKALRVGGVSQIRYSN